VKRLHAAIDLCALALAVDGSLVRWFVFLRTAQSSTLVSSWLTLSCDRGLPRARVEVLADDVEVDVEALPAGGDHWSPSARAGELERVVVVVVVRVAGLRETSQRVAIPTRVARVAVRGWERQRGSEEIGEMVKVQR